MDRLLRAAPYLSLLAIVAAQGCAKDDTTDEAPGVGERNCGEGIGECGEQERCLGGHCVPKDLGDEAGEGEGEAGGDVPCRPACQGAQICGDGGQCEEPEHCKDPADCRAGRVCATHHRCVDVCSAAHCPRDGLCVGASCEPPASCGVDGDCTAGTRCRAGLCYPDCDADDDCPSRQTCGDNGACEPPADCRSHRDCRPDRDCVDGACGPRRSLGCRSEDAGAACLNGKACGPAGVCGRRRGCGADAGCASGVCGPFGLCAPCRVDGDCAGGQTCTVAEFGVGECTEPQACIADIDCLRGRTCGPTGLCGAPADCAEDRLSPNHDRESTVFTEDALHTGLRLCPGADDWFEVFVPTGFGAEIYLTDIDDAGLRLELFADAAAELPLFTADAPGPGERLPITDAPNSQKWGLRVTADQGGTGAYELDVRLRSRGVCLEDPGEDWGGDDGPDTAIPLHGRGGTVNGRRLCEDDDWFLVTIEERSRFDALITPPGLLKLLVLDPSGEPIALSEASPSEASVPGLAPGRYRVGVTSFSGHGTEYSLNWSVRPDEDHLLNRCRGVPTLQSGQRWEGQLLAGQPDHFRGTCAPGDDPGPEAIARIDLDQFADISVRIESADFDPVLYLRRGCAGGTEDTACAHDPGELYGGELPPGVWYVFVDAAGPIGEGHFEAQILTGEVTPPGGNEACDLPARIDVDDDGNFRVRGDTAGANPDLESPDCAPFGDTAAAPDLVYVLTTAADAWLTAEVLPVEWDAVLHVYNDSCDADGLIACGDEPASVSIPRLPAGQHYLVVDGYRGGEAGTFELTGALAEPPPSPDNDACERAQPLELDPETRRASVQGDTTAATDRGEVGCGQAASRLAPDQFFSVTLDAPADLRVQLVPDNGYAPAVALRSGGCRDGVELVCTTAAPHALSAAALLAGDYLIVVDGAQAGSRGRYELIVEATPL